MSSPPGERGGVRRAEERLAGLVAAPFAQAVARATICGRLLESPSKLPLFQRVGVSLHPCESGGKHEADGGGTLSGSPSLMSVD